MREVEPNEEANLSEFQEELVQLCAVLRGDHAKDGFPHEIVKDMKVVEAVHYVDVAFQKFLDDCDDAEKNGADGSHIVCLAEHGKKRVPKTFTQKLFSCLVCDNN